MDISTSGWNKKLWRNLLRCERNFFFFFVLNAKLEFISSFLKQGHDMAKINLRIEQGGNYP